MKPQLRSQRIKVVCEYLSPPKISRPMNKHVFKSRSCQLPMRNWKLAGLVAGASQSKWNSNRTGDGAPSNCCPSILNRLSPCESGNIRKLGNSGPFISKRLTVSHSSAHFHGQTGGFSQKPSDCRRLATRLLGRTPKPYPHRIFRA